MRNRQIFQVSSLLLLGLISLGTASRARAELFVVDSSSGDDAVKMYDTTGQFLGNLVDNNDVSNTAADTTRRLAFPRAAVFDASGRLYVSSFDNSEVRRYTPLGGIAERFANANTTAPGFGQPTGLAIRGSFLFVADSTLSNIKRYDITQSPASAFVGVFAAGDGLSNPEGIAFGPDGNLYVANRGAGNVLRFNGQTGAFIGALNNGASGLSDPQDLAFGPDDDLYVADTTLSGKIPRFDTGTGAFSGFFVNNDANLVTPRTLAWGPDDELYVGDLSGPAVRRYTAVGAPDGTLIPAQLGDNGDLASPADLIFATPYVQAAKMVVSDHWWAILGMAAFFTSLARQARRRPARSEGA